MKNRRIEFNQVGDESVLTLMTSALPEPAAGFVRVKHAAIGVNFIDTYHRSGLYAVPLPSGLGLEAAGWVDAVGEGVSGFNPGDRVAYCNGPLGAYSDFHCVDAQQLLKLPANLAFETVAASLLKGLTAAYLLHETVSVKQGDWILVHAAAGGVGQLLCRWATAMGCRVIGTVGSAAKLDAAKACGCEAVFNYRADNFTQEVRRITDGAGVRVVYDGVGKDTFESSLAILATRGYMVSFGNASGPAPAVSPLALAQKGSLFLTRPTLAHYTQNRQELDSLWHKLVSAMTSPWFDSAINYRYPLADAAAAHLALGSGQTQGALVLIPAAAEAPGARGV